ncbi:sensor histidine kinase [Pedobacter sp. PWIIR3]
MFSAVKDLHAKLVGDVSQTSMQARIFHQLSIIGIIAMPVIILINLFIKVPNVNVILFTTLVLLLGLYYNSRFLGNLKSSLFIFTLCSNLLLIANYFYNSGLQGPTLLLFILCVVFIVSVMSLRQSIFWVMVNACFVTTLISLEYFEPTLIKRSYADRSGYFIDSLSSYLAVILCIIVVLSYLIKSQQQEKMKAIDASRALQDANDAKTKLLSILSHDLRSPLNSIQGFLEVLTDFDLDESEKKAIKINLLQETKNTQTMLFNLLSWTRSQMEGGVKVQLIPVNLLEVVDACISVQHYAAIDKKISISNNIPPHICILADIDMLKLVVRNLLNNAIKFTKTGGEIGISSNMEGDFATLMIRDNGIGFTEEKAKEIFSMKSVSTYGTNNEKGVGLGLLLCKEFTELQNGKITVTSSPGNGTTFFLSFPLSNS